MAKASPNGIRIHQKEQRKKIQKVLDKVTTWWYNKDIENK
nr:MAG TPA: hypothetical protein [Caudoviricetes sp.]